MSSFSDSSQNASLTILKDISKKHQKIEICFKAFAKVSGHAMKLRPGDIPAGVVLSSCVNAISRR